MERRIVCLYVCVCLGGGGGGGGGGREGGTVYISTNLALSTTTPLFREETQFQHNSPIICLLLYSPETPSHNLTNL